NSRVNQLTMYTSSIYYLSKRFVDTSKPALYALINGLMTRDGTTRRKRIPNKVNKPTFTQADKALIHRATGTNVNKITNAININAIIIIGATFNISKSISLSSSRLTSFPLLSACYPPQIFKNVHYPAWINPSIELTQLVYPLSHISLIAAFSMILFIRLHFFYDYSHPFYFRNNDRGTSFDKRAFRDHIEP